MKKRALVTGAYGQDGSFLVEQLLSKNYDVYILKRKNAAADVEPFQFAKGTQHDQDSSATPLKLNNSSTPCEIEASLLDRTSLEKLVHQSKPDEIYHLAAQTFVSYDASAEFDTLQTNILGTQNLLSVCHENFPESKFLFASSAEVFGRVETSPQNENTKFQPRSVYGISKTAGQQIVSYYRENKNYFACSAILFNHESYRRGSLFVTRKITRTAARIKLGLESILELGNLDATRDWGYAPDYTEGMQCMLEAQKPQDFVLASGVSRTVKDFLAAAFGKLNLNYEDYVKVNPKFFRPLEPVPLVGNAELAWEILKWKAKKPFETWVAEMVESDLKKEMEMMKKM